MTHGFHSLHQLEEYLFYHGILAKVYDSYMDPTLLHHEIAIETWETTDVIRNLVQPYWPAGIFLMIRHPGTPQPTKEPMGCICIGPPARDCSIHGEIHG